MGHVKCADCGKVVGTYFDGEDVRVMKHDACGMGGRTLTEQERARRANEQEKREPEARS